jgi:sugar (pentulose or hexulose) kinase
VKYYLLIDFGASRIKSISINEKGICQYEVFYSDGGMRKHGALVPPEFFKISIFQHINYAYKMLKVDPHEILLCTEMHGYSLADKNGVIVTPYYSWRYTAPNSKSAIDILNRKSAYKLTGMFVRNGLPSVNYIAQEKTESLKQGFFLTLPQLICQVSGEEFGVSHVSMTSGTGFYGTGGRVLLVDNLLKSKNGINFPKAIESINEPIGVIQNRSKDIPVFMGIGDFQASVFGANLDHQSILINIGTGSQIAQISVTKKRKKLEYRPYLNGEYLACLTHLPAGRALKAWHNIFNEYSSRSSRKDRFWLTINSLAVEDLDSTGMVVDLAIFDSAYGYKKGGSVKFINESELSFRIFCAAMIKSLCLQYVELIKYFNLDHVKSIILTGGIPSRIPVIREAIANYINLPVEIEDYNIDHSLLGLIKFNRLRGLT